MSCIFENEATFHMCHRSVFASNQWNSFDKFSSTSIVAIKGSKRTIVHLIRIKFLSVCYLQLRYRLNQWTGHARPGAPFYIRFSKFNFRSIAIYRWIEWKQEKRERDIEIDNKWMDQNICIIIYLHIFYPNKIVVALNGHCNSK